jgi:Ca2+/Na+ antiporter
MNFTVAAVATSIAGLILGLGWLFAGSLLLKRWGLEANALGLLVGRRLGAAYLGIAIMLFLGRSAPPSEFRSSVSIAMLVALVLLALLGLIELKAKRVGRGILVSVAVELLLAAGFAMVLLTGNTT